MLKKLFIPIGLVLTMVAPLFAAETFEFRKSINLQGNMKVIGNTVLCPKENGQCIKDTSQRNDEVDLRYTKLNSDSTNPNIFNSSSATLTDSAITSDENAKIVWAGLYWTGYLHTYDEGHGTQTHLRGMMKSIYDTPNLTLIAPTQIYLTPQVQH